MTLAGASARPAALRESLQQLQSQSRGSPRTQRAAVRGVQHTVVDLAAFLGALGRVSMATIVLGLVALFLVVLRFRLYVFAVLWHGERPRLGDGSGYGWWR